MRSLIAAIALQQLQDMEQLKRDFGRQSSRKRRRAAAIASNPAPINAALTNSEVDHAVVGIPRQRSRSSTETPKSITP